MNGCCFKMSKRQKEYFDMGVADFSRGVYDNCKCCTNSDIDMYERGYRHAERKSNIARLNEKRNSTNFNKNNEKHMKK